MVEPYIPERLPIDTIDWGAHVEQIGKANAALARYDGILQGMINPHVLLSPLITREAVLSSRIEGTQASMEEVLEYEADSKVPFDEAKVRDIQEIINYRRALYASENLLKERPICINTIRELHRILLTSVRGRDKEPGEIRRIQNYIAPPGTPIEDATYIPPPPTMVMDYLTNWENYLHMEDRDPLVQLGILKAQFEIIHPFRDGNGRIGRMLIPLILHTKNHLCHPYFYISAFLEHHRDEYYNHLLGVSYDSNWNEWIIFFMKAIIHQAEVNTQKAVSILQLYNEMKRKIPEITRSHYAIQAIDALFSNPIFTANAFMRYSGIPKKSAQRTLQQLTDNELILIHRESKGSKAAVYIFQQLITIAGSAQS